VPGWTAKALLTTLPKPVKVGDITLTKAVTSITWTATAGQGIRPGEFQEFEISAGPLPTAVNSFVLPATQYYSDGETVRWDQPIPVGGKEPEYPAPSLSLAPASDPDSADATEATDDRQHAAIASAHDHPSTTSSTDWLARVLGAGGLLVGLAGAGVALWSRRRAGLAAS
jgi:hypothetical protein